MFDFLIVWIINIPGVNFVESLFKDGRKCLSDSIIRCYVERIIYYPYGFSFEIFFLLIFCWNFFFFSSFFGEFSSSSLSIKRQLKNIRI